MESAMSQFRLSRRGALLGAGAGALAGVAPWRAARAAPADMTVVLESEVVILDPHATTVNITRTFGYHVFDTLFSMDSKGAIKPQMVESHTMSEDGLTWSFTLRPGLVFHDGAPVTAQDCVASLKRWGAKDNLGRMMTAATQTIEAKDPRTFIIALREPFPMMLDVLGKPNAVVPFIMPERIIKAAGDGRITEIIGSGPFRFVADQWRPGNVMTLAKHDGYVPRSEPPDFLAGGKVVKVPRVLLQVMPDDATGVSALIAGEIDYMQFLPFDWLAKLGKTKDIELMELSGIDMYQGNFRLNHATGPFADPAVRQVLWHLVDQNETLQAIGIPDRFRLKECRAFWMCDAPLSTNAGSEVAQFSIAKAKAALAKTKYNGEPVVMLNIANSISHTAGILFAAHMRAAGFTVDEQVMDWGTVLARRAKKDGWSMFPVYVSGLDISSPLTHFYVANSCADYVGWSCDARIPPLLKAFAYAPDLAARREIATKIQVVAYELVPCVMWGQFSRPAGYRSRLKNLVQSSFPMFWNVEVAA
jgi:peptide/nickel transport system substrate-binding protein